MSAWKIVETFRGVAYPWLCDSMDHMNTRRGWVDAKKMIEYRREILSSDLLVISTAMTRVARSSLGFGHELTDLEDGILRATSDRVAIHFDLGERVSLTLPGEMAARAKEYIDDHTNA